MARAPSLLIVAPFVSGFPQRGYEVLLWNHLVSLVDVYDITLVTLHNMDGRTANCDLEGVRHIPVATSKYSLALGVVRCLRRGLPIQSAAFYTKRFDEVLSTLSSEKQFASVLCYMSRVVPIVEKRFSLAKLRIFGIDPLGISYQRQSQEASFLSRVAYKGESLMMGRLDSRLISSDARFALISHHDAREYEEFLQIEKDSIETIPYGVEFPAACLDREDRIPRSAVISGSGSYGPNTRAIKGLLLTQWSDIEKKYGVALRLVGRGHEKTNELIPEACELVEIVGEVDDMFREIQRSMMSLCLVSLDVGVQTKVLEALANGTPVICTSGANKGVGGRNGEEVLIADTAEELDAAISALLDDSALWHRLSNNGRRLVEQRFSWLASAGKIYDFVASPLGTYDHY